MATNKALKALHPVDREVARERVKLPPPAYFEHLVRTKEVMDVITPLGDQWITEAEYISQQVRDGGLGVGRESERCPMLSYSGGTVAQAGWKSIPGVTRRRRCAPFSRDLEPLTLATCCTSRPVNGDSPTFAE